ncbi:MAG: hypothetical protein L6Q31_10590 [Fimbriimonadaceae bacterium]|nr:hypothetical protein [Fimbriimonadaceae bacterium]NUM37946.1 hypothetical protein [Armatimonadota bacterium]
MNSDFKELLSLLEKLRVRYLVVGGYAVMYYTEPRYTKDLNIVVGVSELDIEGLSSALAEFGYPLIESQVEQWREPDRMIILGVPPSRIVLLNQLAGVDFEAAWERRQTVNVGGQSVSFVSSDDLILAKRAAGRPQDHLDLPKLEQAAKRQR